MATDEAFIRAVLAAPRDPGVRQVYADWLEEQGDPRSEYLRLLALVDRPGGDEVAIRWRLRELETTLDLRWVVLMNRGRTLNAPPVAVAARGRRPRRRQERLAEEVAGFVREYARPGPNDRSYDRKLEEKVKRMPAEDLDRLLRGEG